MSDKGGKRLSADSEESSRKKAKKVDGEKYNPYLAHMYDGEENGNGTEPSPNSPLAGFKRQHTTAAQAFKAEDNDSNPFTGRPHSQKYFQILEGRRNLPVHKQRYTPSPTHFKIVSATTNISLDKSSSTNSIRLRSSSSSVRPVPAKPPRSRNTSSTMNSPTSPASSSPAPSPVESPPCPWPSVSPTRWTSSSARRSATASVSRT